MYHHPQCANTCQFVLAENVKAQAMSTYHQAKDIVEGIATMSKALWCDAGDHPFSEKDPEKRHFTESKFSPDKGEVVTEVIDWCGKCADQIMTTRKALPDASQN